MAHRRLSLSHCSEAVRLDVSKYQLYREEKEQLRNTWSRMTQQEEGHVTAETLLVHGNVGAGKRTFVHSLRRPVEMSGGIFLSGTFSNKGSNQPYTAISDAIVDLCEELKHVMGFDNFIRYIGHELVSELSTLTRFLPKLADALQVPTTEGRERAHLSNSSMGSTGQNILERQASTIPLRLSDRSMGSTGQNKMERQAWIIPLRSSDLGSAKIRHFRRLLTVLAQKSGPVLFLLEDLHLADSPSLNLFMELITDPDIKNIMFVGTYTDGESKEVSRFKEMVASDLNGQNKILADLHLKEMTVHEVNQLVAATTEMTAIQTFDLSCVVRQQTGGNFYLVTQFLKLLQEQNLLRYSFESNCWQWDIALIESDTEGVTDNVVDTS